MFVTLPKNLKRIGAVAFADCYFSRLDLPESVTEIGMGAFKNCSFPILQLPSALTKICDYVCENTGLAEIKIPNNIVEIGAGAFANCEHLMLVEIPESVKVIGAGAFIGCNELRIISFLNPDPQSVEISRDAFVAFFKSKPLVLVPKGSEKAFRNHPAFKYCDIKAL